MREAMIRAAQANPGDVSDAILKAAKRKPKPQAGWRVVNRKGGKNRGRGNR
jgi:hypothetical protein